MNKHLFDLGRITRETLDLLATKSDHDRKAFELTSCEPRPHTDRKMKYQEPSPHIARDAGAGVGLGAGAGALL
jgi:hypothetical protein